MAIPFGYFSVATTSKSSELKAVISFLIEGISALVASFFTPSTSQATIENKQLAKTIFFIILILLNKYLQQLDLMVGFYSYLQPIHELNDLAL